MNKLLIAILGSILSCSILLIFSPSAMSQNTKVEQTTDKQKVWIIDKMKEHVKVISLRNGKAHFESDGFFHSGDADMAKTFDKATGEAFSSGADHHSSLMLKVTNISKEKGVTISYLSKFNHKSFGKDLITEDRGEFTLPWK